MKTLDINKKNSVNSKLVLEYLDVKQELKALNDKKDILQAKIRDKMSVREVEILVCDNNYVREIDSKTTTINTKKYERLVNHSEFLKTVKVSVTEAKKLLGTQQLKQISTVTVKPSLITGTIDSE